MTTFTTTPAAITATPSFADVLFAFVDAMLGVTMRELIDGQTGGDKTDAAFAWGL